MKLEEQHFTQPTPALKSIRAHTRAHTHLHTYVHPNTHIHPMRTTPRSTCQEWSWWMLEMQQCDRLLRDQLGCSFRSTLTEAAVLTGHPPPLTPNTISLFLMCLLKSTHPRLCFSTTHRERSCRVTVTLLTASCQEIIAVCFLSRNRLRLQ